MIHLPLTNFVATRKTKLENDNILTSIEHQIYEWNIENMKRWIEGQSSSRTDNFIDDKSFDNSLKFLHKFNCTTKRFLKASKMHEENIGKQQIALQFWMIQSLWEQQLDKFKQEN